jgi:ribosomal silencing factor RsfS
MEPPIHLPKKAQTNTHDGWAMVDAGEFAVHILSAKARERYFGDRSLW